MENLEFLGYLGALMVGMVLGLIGGGGSILAVPIFTYLFHISPATTTAYSLFVVGTSASIAALRNLKSGSIDHKFALLFAIPAFISVFAVRKFLLPSLPEELYSFGDFILTKDMAIMVLFAILMGWAAISMLIDKSDPKIDGSIGLSYNYPLIIIEGISIGALTGFVGIGGGFLIIPALVILVKLPMKKAVHTSLFIIALNSLVGFAGDLGNLEINWGFLLSFTSISILGIILGIHFSVFIKAEKLQKTFGWIVLVMAMGIICEQLL